MVLMSSLSQPLMNCLAIYVSKLTVSECAEAGGLKLLISITEANLMASRKDLDIMKRTKTFFSHWKVLSHCQGCLIKWHTEHSYRHWFIPRIHTFERQFSRLFSDVLEIWYSQWARANKWEKKGKREDCHHNNARNVKCEVVSLHLNWVKIIQSYHLGMFDFSLSTPPLDVLD